MPAPRASAGRLDILALLQQAMTGMFAPQREDGLKALSVGQQPNPHGLWGKDLVAYWSSLDENTPDKMNFGRARQLALESPDSPFGKWMQGIGGMQGGAFSGAAAYNRALGQGGGGGGGLNMNSPWVNPASAIGKIFR